MKICVQVAVNLTPADFWTRFVDGLPPENRRVGPVDLPTSSDPAGGSGGNSGGDSGEGSSAPPFPFTLAITHWDEGRAIAVQMSGPWFLREIGMFMILDSESR